MRKVTISDNQRVEPKHFKDGPGFYIVHMGGEEHLCFIAQESVSTPDPYPLFVGFLKDVDENTRELLESQFEEKIEQEEPQQQPGFVSENFALKMAALIKSKNVNINDINI